MVPPISKPSVKLHAPDDLRYGVPHFKPLEAMPNAGFDHAVFRGYGGVTTGAWRGNPRGSPDNRGAIALP